MSFWSSEKLLQRLAWGGLIEPPNPDCVKHGAYELSLGPEVFLTSEPGGTKRRLEHGDQLIIPPGQFGLLLTEESVSIPANAIAFISIRFSIKCQGLINVSGFHVDPGFSGHLKFAVYNAGSQSIPLTRGDRIFLMWFGDLSAPTLNIYDGEHFHQDGITSDDVRALQGEVASPAALKRQIDEVRGTYDGRLTVLDEKLEQRLVALDNKIGERLTTINDKIATWKAVAIGTLTSIVVGIALLVLTEWLQKPAIPASPAIEGDRGSQPVENANRNAPAATGENSNSVAAPTNGLDVKPKRRR